QSRTISDLFSRSLATSSGDLPRTPPEAHKNRRGEMGNSCEAVPTERTGLVTRPLPPDDARRPRLVLRLPDGSIVKLDRCLRVGQSSKNDVVLRDSAISRRHCIIDVEEERVTVRDLSSTNGTWVNGMRVQKAELKSGFTLALGSAR